MSGDKRGATRHRDARVPGTTPGASCPRLVPTLARDIHALSTRSPPTRTRQRAPLRTRRDPFDADGSPNCATVSLHGRGARSRNDEANLRIGGKSDLRLNRVSTARSHVRCADRTPPPDATTIESRERPPQSYLMYLKRGSSGVPSKALSGPGRQPTVSSILRASAKSLSVTPLAEWVTSFTITKA